VLQRPQFKTAKELGLTKQQHEGLVKTLELLETSFVKRICIFEGEKSRFDMGTWSRWDYNRCQTVRCIGGWANTLVKDCFSSNQLYSKANATQQRELCILFYPNDEAGWKATVDQAAIALRGYLTTGKVDWAYATQVGA